MHFYVDSGEYKGLTGYMNYTALRRNKRVSYNSLDKDSKKKYQDGVAKIKNCHILEYSEGYKVNKPMLVRDIYGCTHQTTFTELKRRKPFGEVSIGEYTIDTLLRGTGYTYERQYRINTGVGVQYCDFFVNELNVVIEYDGIQHYEEVPYFSKTLAQVKRYDAEKDLKLKELGVGIIRIPYTVVGYNDISKYLLERGVHIKDSVGVPYNSVSDSEFLRYYETHTREEVARKFNISKQSVTKRAKSLGYRKSKPKYNPDLLKKIKQLYITENKSRSIVANTLGISLSTVSKYSKSLGYKKKNSRYMAESKITKI